MKPAQETSSGNIYKRSLKIALAVLFLIICAEIIAISNLNSGHFIFTVDDAYIHLSLAENILKGYYGINPNEFCAPSSSILWPFLIAPFTFFSNSAYAILIINILLAMGTIYIFWKLLLPASSPETDQNIYTSAMFTIILTLMIPATNVIGLIFIGMEHSLQLFLSILIIYGLVCEMENNIVTWWFLGSIVLAPLIRYECLALSLPALVLWRTCGQ